MHALHCLLEKGVRIPDPESVHIGEDIDPGRIEPGVVLHSGTRISGPRTYLSTGTVLGEEGAVVLENVGTGRNVRLKGGYFADAVFLEGASAGLGAHVRAGTILEEEAGIAHTVGLKQTILFPWATLGSLINFCDVLLSGGEGKHAHSEVGSAYIHFNFTPNQDKATASLLGNVPEGVMLDRPPIFLGGQGGLVGPCQLAFGTVVAAGTLQRKDEHRINRMLFGGAMRPGNIERKPGNYVNLKRILEQNVVYVGNLLALRQWYREIRGRLIGDIYPKALHELLLGTLEMGISERIKRIRGLAGRVEEGSSRSELGDAFVSGVGTLCDVLPDEAESEKKAIFLKAFDNLTEEGYLDRIRSLDGAARQAGSAWLQDVVDQATTRASGVLPALFARKG